MGAVLVRATLTGPVCWSPLSVDVLFSTSGDGFGPPPEPPHPIIPTETTPNPRASARPTEIVFIFESLLTKVRLPVDPGIIFRNP